MEITNKPIIFIDDKDFRRDAEIECLDDISLTSVDLSKDMIHRAWYIEYVGTLGSIVLKNKSHHSAGHKFEWTTKQF